MGRNTSSPLALLVAVVLICAMPIHAAAWFVNGNDRITSDDEALASCGSDCNRTFVRCAAGCRLDAQCLQQCRAAYGPCIEKCRSG
uniref:Uncharacterized protein n=1 Tax=Kalanchoe fedtschenkoi TaxID=63787 RepID=A0A7N0U990_KALFE